MKYIHILLIFSTLLISLPFQSCSQSYATKKTAEGKTKRIFDRGVEYKKNGISEKAIKDFNTVIGISPNFIDPYLQLASIYMGQKSWEKGAVNLEKAITIDPLYEPRAKYYLGICNWELDNFEEAAQNFEQFLESYTSNRGTIKDKAAVYLKNSQFAANAVKNPVPFDPQPLANTINSKAPEYLPSITADGNTLIFTRRIGRQEDVYESIFENGAWQTATSIDNINTDENEGSQYISADGQSLVFVKCSDRSGYGGCDLYFSEKTNGDWSTPKNMGQPINTKGWESQPSLSADGRLLYFASNRDGGVGGRDIWLSYRRKSGNWAKPINLGEVVNTPKDDEAPFYHPDGNTLYFMSNGHPGMGGYDLFVSRRSAEGKWEAVQNLGYPINTKGNEGALFITLDGKTAYFTKDGLQLEEAASVLSKAKRQPDIFTFDLPTSLQPNPVTYVKATVKDAITKKRIAKARIELIELSTGTTLSTAQTDEQGQFLTALPLGNDYAMNINKETYLFHSENFALAQSNTITEPFQLNIELQSIPEETVATIEKAKPIILKNVFFETGSAELMSTSLIELNRLKDLLVDNPQLKIQINGHTDNVGSEGDNQSLSTKRAKAVQDYLIKEGIASNRLKYKGFGESQPIASNDSADGKRTNRRTEFILF